MANYALGDLHGAHLALLQVLEQVNFSYEKDTLVLLGDVADGWPFVRECVDELLKMDDVEFVRGNHDQWFIDYLNTGETPEMWTSQGGAQTLESYKDGVPDSHRAFFKRSSPLVTVQRGLRTDVFVHGGLDLDQPLNLQDDNVLMWDRNLIRRAYHAHLLDADQQWGTYDRIYLGHTPTIVFKEEKPMVMGNVVALDTGAGWDGRLTLWNIDTDAYVQSENVQRLYPGVKGRF